MFERVIGQVEVLSQLRKMLIDGDVNGVFLFHGPRSVGKHTVAREFAKLSVCSGTMEQGCACDNCRLFPAIPDYLSIDDGEKIIKVDEAKSVDQFLSLVPYSAKRRAIVLDDAERMNQQASYSLLNTLEEAGDRSLVILVSSDESRISPTIMSRCIPLQFGPLSPAEVSDVLSMQGHPRLAVEDVCLAMPGFSRSVLRDYTIYAGYMRRVPAILKAMVTEGDEEALVAATAANDAGQAVHFVEALVSLLCDILKAHYDRPGDMASQSQSNEIEALTEAWTDELCIASCARLGEVLEAIRSPLNLKVGPRLLTALSWMSLYVSQSQIRKRMAA